MIAVGQQHLHTLLETMRAMRMWPGNGRRAAIHLRLMLALIWALVALRHMLEEVEQDQIAAKGGVPRPKSCFSSAGVLLQAGFVIVASLVSAYRLEVFGAYWSREQMLGAKVMLHRATAVGQLACFLLRHRDRSTYINHMWLAPWPAWMCVLDQVSLRWYVNKVQPVIFLCYTPMFVDYVFSFNGVIGKVAGFIPIPLIDVLVFAVTLMAVPSFLPAS